MSDMSQGSGWWIASDGKWYPPELHPSQREAVGVAQTDTAASNLAPHSLPQSPFGWSQLSGPTVPATDAAWPTVSSPATPSGQWGSAPGVGGLAYSTGAPLRQSIGRRRRTVVLIVLALLLAGAGTLVTVARSNGPSYPPTWNPRILSIVHFVEQERGLTFQHPVKVEFLDKAQFEKEVNVPPPRSATERKAITQTLEELRALGLVHGNPNLAQSENQLTEDGVVGLYVYTKKTVFVRGTSLTPYVRVTLAHELTHALQDQYFDLSRLRETTPGDGSALTALIEGDAVRVQNAYERTLSAADQRTYDQESNEFQQSSGTSSSSVPAVLDDVMSYPYAFGPAFIDDLVSHGGNTAVDNAFRNPPTAEVQIIDPVAYPIGWQPIPVPAPPVPHGDRVTDPASPFGQLGIFEVLGSQLGYDTAWKAVQGWTGDSSLSYRAGHTTCDAIQIAMKTAGETNALTTAARQWANDAGTHATVNQSDRRLTIRSCDPGPKAPPAPTINQSAFDVLAARAQLIDEIIVQGHTDFALGACVSDSVLRDLGPANYSELGASTLTTGQQLQLQQSVARGARLCRATGVN